MKQTNITLPRPHSAQQRVIDESARFNVLACGRRWGKTQLGIDRLVQKVLNGLPTGWFSPTYRHLSDTWRELCDVLDPVIADRSQQERRLDLIGGGVIEMWSLDTAGDAARGRRYARVVVDECALVPDLERAWQSSIRPMLTDYQGDAWFLSTPKGIQHYFHTLYQRGQDPERADWRSWQMPTAANPHIKPEEIEAARRDMTDVAFAQEYLGQFVSWSGAVFRRILDAIIDPVPEELKRQQVTQWNDREPRGTVIGVDWARTNDYTVFVVETLNGIVVEIDRFRGMEYALQMMRLKSLIWKYRPVCVLAEANSIGGPILEQLQRDDVRITPFNTTNSTKSKVIETLALAFEKGEIRIPNDPVLLGELQAFEATTLQATGLTRYAAPDGGHDDMVIALALAHTARSRGGAGYVPTAKEIEERRQAGRELWGSLMSGGGV